MSNKEALNNFVNSDGIEKSTLCHIRPVTDFVEYLDIKKFSYTDLTADIINQYIEERGFRKFPLMRFKFVLMKFLKYVGSSIEVDEITTIATVDYYYDFEQLMEEFEANVISIVSPFLDVADRYNSYKAILCLMWMEFSISDISEIQMEDVTDEGVLLNGKLTPYNEQEIKDFLHQYKKSDGYRSVYQNSFRYTEYVNDGMLIRTSRKSSNPRQKIYNLTKVMTKDFNIDTQLVIESAMLYRLYQEELAGNMQNINQFTSRQSANYNQYKKKLKEYMEA